MQNPNPKVPDMLNPFAREVLEELSGKTGAETIVIGGGVALQHYLPFRQTADLDAWWAAGSQAQQKQEASTAIKEAMQKVAAAHGMELAVRSFGDTDSYEMRQGQAKRFSLQISTRSAEIEKPQPSAWSPVKIETLQENVGAKMNALVTRGAPRDFVDIYAVCQQGLRTPKECWQAWAERNPGIESAEASAKVMSHLKDLEARRPLDQISDTQERIKAAITRTWFKTDFAQELRHDLGY